MNLADFVYIRDQISSPIHTPQCHSAVSLTHILLFLGGFTGICDPPTPWLENCYPSGHCLNLAAADRKLWPCSYVGRSKACRAYTLLLAEPTQASLYSPSASQCAGQSCESCFKINYILSTAGQEIKHKQISRNPPQMQSRAPACSAWGSL